jgi:hypothetical protein
VKLPGCPAGIPVMAELLHLITLGCKAPRDSEDENTEAENQPGRISRCGMMMRRDKAASGLQQSQRSPLTQRCWQITQNTAPQV